MEDKYYIRDKVRSILMEDPSLFPAFKSSFVDAKTISHVIYKYPSLIAHVKNPGFELCKMAVELEPVAIKLIPSKYQKPLKMIACKKNPELIGYFLEESWSHDEILELIDYRPSSVRYFKNIGKRYIKYAISLDPNLELYYPEHL